MKQVLARVAVVALGLMTVSGVQASNGGNHHGSSKGSSHHGSVNHVSHHKGSGSHKSSGSGQHSGNKSHHNSHARHNRHGHFYHGRHHDHWSYFCWDGRYGCRVYYDPGVCCYYYYCVPDDCYYPVTYCPYGRYSWGTPVADATAVTNVNVTGAPPVPAPAVGGVAMVDDDE
jgi:hypothetical protein